MRLTVESETYNTFLILSLNVVFSFLPQPGRMGGLQVDVDVGLRGDGQGNHPNLDAQLARQAEALEQQEQHGNGGRYVDPAALQHQVIIG